MGDSHIRCALLRGASRNTRSVLPAQHNNAQRIVNGPSDTMDLGLGSLNRQNPLYKLQVLLLLLLLPV